MLAGKRGPDIPNPYAHVLDPSDATARVADGIRAAAPGVTVVPTPTLRGSLAAWLPAGREPEADDLVEAARRPEAAATMAALGLRAIVTVYVSTSSEAKFANGGPALVPIFFVFASNEDYRCHATGSVVDRTPVEGADVVTKGKSVSLFFLLAGFDAVPMVERTALTELGRRLGSFLAGTPAPDVASAQTPASACGAEPLRPALP